MTESFNLTVFHPFLNGIGVDALARLSTCATPRDFEAGARIFDEGGTADRFWLIVAGHVQLDAYLPGRGFVLIESMGAGSVLGWSWLFPPYAWYFGATAVASTSTVEFDAPGVRAMCEADPALGFELTRRFMRVVVDRLQATRIRLLDLYRSP
jgi:CRP-like cAMP-binding protein